VRFDNTGRERAGGKARPFIFCFTLTLRIPEDKHARLRRLAQSRGQSVNKLVDELFTVALAQHDSEARFRARASLGSPKRLLELLDKLDQEFAEKKAAKDLLNSPELLVKRQASGRRRISAAATERTEENISKEGFELFPVANPRSGGRLPA